MCNKTYWHVRCLCQPSRPVVENGKGHQMFLLSFSSQSHCFPTLPQFVFISLLVLTLPSPICLNHPSGLLTVDPERRLKLSDLKENSWLQGGASMSTTPLCTPDVLESSGPTVRTYVNATYKVKALCSKLLKQMSRACHLSYSSLYFGDIFFSSLRPLTVANERVSS